MDGVTEGRSCFGSCPLQVCAREVVAISLIVLLRIKLREERSS